jgi:phospholipid/cholesterol/gamma-HCH transport system permease protein
MNAAAPPTVSVSSDGDAAVVRLSGTWSLSDGLRPAGELTRVLEASPVRTVRFDAGAVERWDTSLVVFLARLHDSCREREVGLDTSGLPAGARRLLELARQGAVLGGGAPPGLEERSWRERRKGRGARGGELWLDRLGWKAIHSYRALGGKIDFFGSTMEASLRMLRGRTRRLRTRFLHHLQQAGVDTLPVVALMGFAIGAVLALITTGQLERVGATPLVARIVSIAVLREMGALMVGIAIAGRLGSAIAAEIASMVARREVDVLGVIGVDRFDYLIAPRVLALAIAGPLLVIYANAMGLLGGLFVGVTVVGLPAQEYIERTRAVLTHKHMAAGLIKGFAFGIMTALVAGYYGLRSGRTAGAVGWAVRKAVVAAVVGVVLTDAAITLVFKWVRL